MAPARQRETMERLIAECSERAYHFAYRLCGRVDEAQELVQEAFVRAFDNWSKYDPGQPFEKWLLTILRNAYLTGARRAARAVSLDAPLHGDEEAGLTLADALADPREEAALERLERRRCEEDVRAALDALSVEHKAILTLCDMEGLGYEQIAEVLDLPLGTVRSRLFRARAAFKKELTARTREEAL